MDGLTEGHLRELAGARSYERGLAYVDAVSGVRIGDDVITASVHGTERYEAELTPAGPLGLTGRCDCPYGQEGNFCKHLVALGLTLIARGADVPRQRKAARRRARGLDAWLSALSRDELLALVREEVAEDPHVRRRLELRAASAQGDLAGVRSRVRELLDTGPFARYGYVEYGDARAYTDQAGQAVSALRSLTAAGRAADAVALAREAIGLLADAMEHVDDADGRLAAVAAALADAHHDACRADPAADQEELAHWLVRHALDDACHLTDIDPVDYEDILGSSGMAALRRHAVAAWQANRTGWSEKSLMQRLAKAGRDVDTVIAVHAADLTPDGHTHLVIARELEAAGRRAEAREWAERGIRDAGDLATVDTALVDHLADRHAQAGRLTEALALRRRHFEARRTPLCYRHLRAAAQAAGCWPAEREKALDLLRAAAEHDGAEPSDRRRPGAAEHRSTEAGRVLVAVLLDDEDVDGAWRAAVEHGAHDTHWLALADRARATRPADALAVYLRLAEPLARRTGNAVYEQLVELLLSMRDCHRRLGTPDDFTAHVAALRATYGRRRNLMRLMDEHGLTG
ncbi:SWIM zinc finger domain-containing protein [Streptomyces sp. CC210A]|uniref:SWIM zinc finger family protein n=1 Tax=Streptomyces sp. CC210A TaxID=2898184 RepID=UPI001F2B01D7|nr:SWIM zinc finger family protein [Streptomyces sp. CC210A]